MALAGESGQAAGSERPAGSPVAAVGGTASLGPELRRLRKAQGLSQRALAQRLGYSAHSAIADYENGRRVPANDVLICYERLFQLPAGELQRLRAVILCGLADEQFREQTAAAVPLQAPAGDQVPGQGEGAAPRRRLRRMPRGRVMIPVVAAALLAVAAGGWAMTRDSASGPALDPTWAQANQHVTDQSERTAAPENMDGDDPRARDCVFDAVVRDTVPLLLPGGRPFGVLRLRHSARCGASWGSAIYHDPRLYTVQITALRPADGAEARSQWSNNTPPGSYGDMLSTAAGCVRVTAVVITPSGTGPSAATPCLK